MSRHGNNGFETHAPLVRRYVVSTGAIDVLGGESPYHLANPLQPNEEVP